MSVEFSVPPRETRPRRTRLGTRLRWLAWGSLAAIIVVIIVLASERPSDAPRPAPIVVVPPVPAETNPPRTANSVPPVEPEPQREPDSSYDDERLKLPGQPAPPAPSEPSEPPPSSIAQQIEHLEDAVVRIESGEAGGPNELGTGFILDADGLVATNFHVVASATEARVRFKNGAAYEVEGYAAVDPETDLAILRLREPPTTLHALELADDRDPPRLSPVVAIGHPQGLSFSPFDGKVSRVLRTSELPASSQRFLRQLIAGRVDHSWIQHTASISEGNSGGPLLDERGRVLGVNTWVDRQARFSYALHASHVRELWSEVSEETAPLRRHARKGARVADLLNRLTAERLEQLWAAAEKMNWRPESTADYEVLQELAWSVTVINLPATLGGGKLDDRLDSLAQIADRIVGQLGRKKWDALAQLTLVNDLAATQINRPMAGVFFFAQVERVVEGDEGARAALLLLAGSDVHLLIPLDDQLTVPAAGQQCLVLGVNYDGRTVRYGENPLKLTTAHVIASRTILKID